MAEEKWMARKAIITLLTTRIFRTTQKNETRSITEKCNDRSSMKIICMDTEKCMTLFAEKIGVQNTQSLQGSVGIHRSTSTYTCRRMKDVQYRSYMHWKVTGIMNPEFWDFMIKPARALDSG
eukprot:4019849-Ditylum_brightwellii.AAC.1